MKKYIQDYSVMSIIILGSVLIGLALGDWLKIDVMFGAGFFAGGVYYDWYKKQ